ncbi:hypothetical protein HK097_000898, partial [Rhizophlyctis rosea]
RKLEGLSVAESFEVRTMKILRAGQLGILGEALGVLSGLQGKYVELESVKEYLGAVHGVFVDGEEGEE